MSRYEIEHGDYQIVVGWDSPMDTFFAQVDDSRDKEAEEPLVWIGEEFGDFRDLETFNRALSQKLATNGILDFALTTGQLEDLQRDYREKPPGTNLSNTAEGIRRFYSE